MKESRYNILYKGQKIYQDLTIEECSEIFQDLSERYNSGETINSNDLEMEKIYG